jgi:uncharacterized protein with HEPN domain
VTEAFRLIDRLAFMIEMIDRIDRQLNGVTSFQFGEDSDLIDTTMFRLAQIGEGATHLPNEVTLRHPDIPWPKMRGLRNLIVHEYRKVAPARIWDTARDLAGLRQILVEEQGRV